MAIRAILKKLSSFPQSRCCLTERRGGVLRIHLYSTGNNRGGGPIDHEEEEQRSELEPKVAWKANNGEEWQCDHRYLRSPWKERNEKEQRSYVDLRSCSLWLKSVHEVTKDEESVVPKEEETGDDRLLLCMKIPKPDETHSTKNLRGGVIEFTTASADTGSIHNTRKLVVNRVPFELPSHAVNGLVLITKAHKAFLIYNSVTGDVSDWIPLTRKSLFRTGRVGAAMGRRVESIALGYIPKTKHYKVVCISKTLKKHTRVIQVLDDFGATPWYRVGTTKYGRLIYCDGITDEIVDDPCYVHGVIHWPFKHNGNVESILTFDVESDNVNEIPIHPDSVSPGFRLLEVDGRVAVFQKISDYEASLWVIRVYKDDLLAWFEEKITMPYAWTIDPEFSIEALAGTNLILIKQDRQNCVFCYNRRTKKCHKFPTSPHHGPPYDWERIVQL